MSHILYPMGDRTRAEEFRARIYSGSGRNADDERRVAFLRACAGEGVIDCPAYDPWVQALQARGWLPAKPELEPNPDGEGKIGRWRLTPYGHEQWAAIEKERQI